MKKPGTGAPLVTIEMADVSPTPEVSEHARVNVNLARVGRVLGGIERNRKVVPGNIGGGEGDRR